MCFDSVHNASFPKYEARLYFQPTRLDSVSQYSGRLIEWLYSLFRQAFPQTQRRTLRQ
ncbi:hypothetical protein HMPREF9370_0387 [Neisseria wadsworthii 9715]|uniref:Uncharacterized protein n=1 Tax=Neisseria wadsworthii 9715 TaxID=1030841 RepID=G4CMS8_9NEIS|nr:hypothetical protein HMPREF9370_0387 [Neisseria wadsworthii 9715]